MAGAGRSLPLSTLAHGGVPAVQKLVDVCDALPSGPLPCQSFVEGPAVDAAGTVYFSDEPYSRILRYHPETGRLDEFLRPAFRANGMTFDREGRLLTCNGARPGGDRTVARFEKDGTRTILAHSYRGGRLNSPNDLVVDARGRVWFTDPRYTAGPPLEQDAQAVYRIDAPDPPPGEDPNTSVIRVLGRGDVSRPNGIALSPDGRTLYVADTDDPPGARRILAFALGDDGLPHAPRILHDFGDHTGADGLRVDVEGFVHAAAGDAERGDAAVYVFAPSGALTEVIPVPETPSNLAFDGRTLYITATRSLYRTQAERPGYAVYPPRST